MGKFGKLAGAATLAAALSGSLEAQEAQPVSFETLDTTVVEQIAAYYQECMVEIVISDLDMNENGKVDPGEIAATEDAEFYAEGEEFYQEELVRKVAHAEKMAAGEVRIAQIEANIAKLRADTAAANANIAKQNELQVTAEAGTAAAIERSRQLTNAIIAGAKKEAGL